MFIVKTVFPQVDVSREYRFPYLLLDGSHGFGTDLNFVESAFRPKSTEGLLDSLRETQGGRVFAQVEKIDALLTEFLKREVHVGKFTVYADVLCITINNTAQRWEPIEKLVENIFCLPIKK